MAISHADHDHPNTPAARRACRARLAAQATDDAPNTTPAPVTRPAPRKPSTRAARPRTLDMTNTDVPMPEKITIKINARHVRNAVTCLRMVPSDVDLVSLSRDGETPIGVDNHDRALFACQACGEPHNVTATWCAGTVRQLAAAADKDEAKGRKVNTGMTASTGSRPATGLMDRHTDPITLRMADGRPAPVPVAPQATDKQVAFIEALVADRDVPTDVLGQVQAWLAREDRPKSQASEWITRLKEFPFPPRPVITHQPLPDVPAGSYAIDTVADDAVNEIAFYRVWIGRTGFVKVYRQEGPSSIAIAWKDVPGILGRIEAAGTEDALRRYGQELGECGHCHRPLTNDESRARGIGPICARKRG